MFYKSEQTNRFLELCGYKIVRPVPFSQDRLAAISELAATCLMKAMSGREATREDNAALSKIYVLSNSMDHIINSPFRYVYNRPMLKVN